MNDLIETPQKPGRGGKRDGAGRPKGATFKATVSKKRSLTLLAQTHTETALNTLVAICKNENEPAAARVTAANSILDRGYGRAPQAILHQTEDGAPLFTFLQGLVAMEQEENGEVEELEYHPFEETERPN